jgi:hypothetical protein
MTDTSWTHDHPHPVPHVLEKSRSVRGGQTERGDETNSIKKKLKAMSNMLNSISK